MFLIKHVHTKLFFIFYFFYRTYFWAKICQELFLGCSKEIPKWTLAEFLHFLFFYITESSGRMRSQELLWQLCLGHIFNKRELPESRDQSRSYCWEKIPQSIMLITSFSEKGLSQYSLSCWSQAQLKLRKKSTWQKNQTRGVWWIKNWCKGTCRSWWDQNTQIFIHDESKHADISASANSVFFVPIINLERINDWAKQRDEIIKEVGEACEKWGFFQVFNHGIPSTTLEEEIRGVRGFHEQDPQIRKNFYSRDVSKRITYNSNFDFFQIGEPAGETLCLVLSHQVHQSTHDFPQVCRY